MSGKSEVRVSCTDQVLKITESPVIASGGLNEVSVIFSFCEKWDGFVKTAIFYRDEENVYYAVLDENDTCVVPWEVCYEEGTFYFSVFGEKADSRRTASVVRYKAKKGAITTDMLPSDPTPEVYDQIVAMLADMRESQAGFISLAEKAIADANTATQNAQNATANANTATVDANTATTRAYQAAENANASANNANAEAGNAMQATAKANEATTNANNAANEARTATEETNTARETFLQDAGEILSSLSGAVYATPIECAVTGDVIAVKDASNQQLAGLNIYGKTTQSGTPTPTSSVPLESAGESGSISVTVAGKNLFDDVAWFKTYNGILQSDGSWFNVYADTACFTNTARKSGSMYLTVIAKSVASDSVKMYLQAYYTDGSKDNSIRIDGTNGFETVTAKTNPNKTVDYIKWSYGSGGDWYVKGVMISFVDNEYEPYKGQTAAFSTPNGLNGVPMPDNVGDGFTYTYDYIDGDGNKRIADYVDVSKGVRVQRLKRHKVTQAHAFHGVKNGFGQFHIMLPSDRKLGSYCLCTHYPVPIDFQNADYANPTRTGVVYKRISSNPGMLFVNHEGITTLEDYNAWLAENQPEFLYELATPIETPLPAEELSAYAALHSNKPNTTVLNDGGAGLKLAYNADTKLYIDNKINELATAILNNA